jgi:hypothetical protein
MRHASTSKSWRADMRFYKIVVGSQTFDATNDPNALNVECDIAVTYHNAPANGNSSFVRVWGIPLQTILTANRFNNQPIQVFGGMQQGLPLANPNQQGLLVQGIVFPALGNWVGTDMTIDFYIKVDSKGSPTVGGAANLVHNQPAQQPMATAIQNALQTAFPSFTANVKISPNLVRPNDEHGFYQSLGQYATFLNQASHDIVKTAGYLGVQMSVQGNTINVFDGTQGQTGAKTVNPQDLVGQPIWTNVNTCQFKWRHQRRRHDHAATDAGDADDGRRDCGGVRQYEPDSGLVPDSERPPCRQLPTAGLVELVHDL